MKILLRPDDVGEDLTSQFLSICQRSTLIWNCVPQEDKSIQVLPDQSLRILRSSAFTPVFLIEHHHHSVLEAPVTDRSP